MYRAILNENTDLEIKISTSVKQLLNYVFPNLKNLALNISKLVDIIGLRSIEGVVLSGVVKIINFLTKKIPNLLVKKESFLQESNSFDRILLLFLRSLIMTVALLAGISYITLFSVLYISKDLKQNFVYTRLISSSKSFLQALSADFYKKSQEAKTEKERELYNKKYNAISWKLKHTGQIVVKITKYRNKIQSIKETYKKEGKNAFMQYLLTFGQVLKTFEALEVTGSFLYVPIVALSYYIPMKLPASLEKLKRNIQDFLKGKPKKQPETNPA